MLGITLSPADKAMSLNRGPRHSPKVCNPFLPLLLSHGFEVDLARLLPPSSKCPLGTTWRGSCCKLLEPCNILQSGSFSLLSISQSPKSQSAQPSHCQPSCCPSTTRTSRPNNCTLPGKRGCSLLFWGRIILVVFPARCRLILFLLIECDSPGASIGPVLDL